MTEEKHSTVGGFFVVADGGVVQGTYTSLEEAESKAKGFIALKGGRKQVTVYKALKSFEAISEIKETVYD